MSKMNDDWLIHIDKTYTIWLRFLNYRP